MLTRAEKRKIKAEEAYRAKQRAKYGVVETDILTVAEHQALARDGRLLCLALVLLAVFLLYIAKTDQWSWLFGVLGALAALVWHALGALAGR